MKVTHRDDWRVIIEIRPRYTHTRISALGFTGLDHDLDGELMGEPFELTIAPRRLGDLGGGISVGDSLASRDIDGAYKRRCEAMLAELLQAPHVRSGRVTCTETHTCSYCGCGWEVLTADEAADDSTNQDEHSVEGEPVCCDRAIAEFRTERGVTVHADGVVAYRHRLSGQPDRLLCRRHGYPWFAEPLTSDDLPDGGICTYARGGRSECGRDVLAVETGGAA